MKLFFSLNLIFFLLVIFSCKPQQENELPIPEGLLEEELLVNTLAQSYLAEGASGINIKNVSGEKYDSTYLFNPVKENGIDKVKFDSTMAYYTRHPKKMKLIYEKVLDKLSIYQASGRVQ